MEPGEYVVIAAVITGVTGLAGNIVTAYASRQPGSDKSSGSSKRSSRGRPVARHAVFTSLILVSGVALWYYTRTRLHIDSPSDGALVNIREDVHGSAKRVPARHVLRLVVFSEVDRRFFPDSSPVLPDRSHRWVSPGIAIGAAQDSGRTFELLVVGADSNASARFDEYFSRLDRFGMVALPPGTVTYDRVRVTRQK
jgi:hypothetical protein